jgi:hypothetical protein
MKELVYKAIDGINPIKKEVSIEEIDDCVQTRIKKKWTCKYFLKSYHVSRSEVDLKKWLCSHGKDSSTVKNCHILKKMDTKTGQTKIVCKVLGEFFAVNGLTVIKIVYMNSLNINMEKKVGE